MLSIINSGQCLVRGGFSMVVGLPREAGTPSSQLLPCCLKMKRDNFGFVSCFSDSFMNINSKYLPVANFDQELVF